MRAVATDTAWPGRRAMVRQDRVAQLVLLMPMGAYTLLSKIAIPLGATQLPSFLPVVMLAVPFGLLTGRLKIQPENLIFLLAMSSVLILEQIFTGNNYSITSLILVLAVQLPYAFQLKPGLLAPDFHLRAYQDIALTLAICGTAQFFAQFAIGSDAAFAVDTKLPQSIIMQGFNNMNPLGYGSSIIKSNGVFLIEPSFFSLLLAISLIVELTYFRRLWRVGCIIAGLVVSFSGTGLVLLAFALPVAVIQHRRYEYLFIAGAGVLLVVFGASALGLDYFTNRLEEFNSTGSSGFARYEGGFYLMSQYLWPDPMRALFGFGAGTVLIYIDRAIYSAWDPSWVKIPFEFGLLGVVVYFPFVFFCTLRAPGAPTVKTAMLVAFFVGGVLVPPVHTMIISMLVWPWSAGIAPEPFRLGLFGRRRDAMASA